MYNIYIYIYTYIYIYIYLLCKVVGVFEGIEVYPFLTSFTFLYPPESVVAKEYRTVALV